MDDRGVAWTLLGTLYLRACESRSARSILRHQYAAEAIARIDYDFARLDGYRVLFRVMNGIPGLRTTYQELRFTL